MVCAAPSRLNALRLFSLFGGGNYAQSDRYAFASRIGASGESNRYALVVVFNGQPMRVAQAADANIMSHRRQLLPNRLRNAVINRYHVRFDEADARRRDRLLNVHPKIDQVHHHLWDGLHNCVSAGRSDGDPRLPVTHYEGRTEARELATAGEGVHRISFRLEGRIRQRVVEPDAGPFGHDLAAETIPQRLGGCDDVATSVGDHEMRRVLFLAR